MKQGNLFLDSLEQFKSDFNYVSDKEQDLIKIKSALIKKLTKVDKFNNQQINETHPLFQLAKQLKNAVNEGILSWDSKLKEALPMQALCEQFSDRVILLVFGKVNAGKSSFCNFLTGLFPDTEVKRFCFELGEVKYFNGPFVEGVTETTAQIQGVELGSNLVLIDSPGLHSIVDENGELTRRFTDSADAVLWLTPSSSPGQVQELKDLKLELEKKKPLLPIITKSDELDEQWSEEVQDIVQQVRNKSSDRRKLQEEDVYSRVLALGSVDKLKPAISISIHAHKIILNNSSSTAEDSGIDLLYKKLVDIVDDANLYKVNKAKQQMLNFLEGEVLHSLNKNLLPRVTDLKESMKSTTLRLKQKKKNLTQQILSNVLVEVPQIVEKHLTNKDKNAISRDLNHIIEKQISEILAKELAEYVTTIQQVSSDLSDKNIGEFKDITIDVKEVTGSRSKSLVSWGGGIGGAAAGFAIGGPVGGVIGGLLGAWGGEQVGEKIFVNVNWHKEKVGVSPEHVIESTCASVSETLPALVEKVFVDIEDCFFPLQHYADSIVEAIKDCTIKTQKLQVK